MDIVKDRIRTKQLLGRAVSQMTLEDDFNVPDVKPDIDEIIEAMGGLKITEARAVDGRIIVKGRLEFQVLYIGSGAQRPMNKLSGSLPFEETFLVEGISPEADVKTCWDMEDLRARMINSRKLSVRSIVSLTVTAFKITEEEMAVDIAGDDSIYTRPEAMEVSRIHSQKRDIIRVKKEISVPSSKPNILEIIWDRVTTGSLDVRVLDNRINVRGSFDVFVMYASPEEKQPLQYFNCPLDFNESVDCEGAAEEMIGHVEVRPVQHELTVRENEDGEQRRLEAELVLEVYMTVYEEKQMTVLTDIYSNCKHLEPVMREIAFDNILMKNQSGIRLSQQIKIENHQAKILQICQTDANVKMDSMEMTKSGILVQGVIYVQILYIAADDRKPLSVLKGMIPFSHVIEVEGIHEGCTFEIIPAPFTVNSTMADSETIDVKAELCLDTIVFEMKTMKTLADVSVSQINEEEREHLPAIAGYVVHEGDTLWTLAKQFYTTKEKIMEINGLESEELKPKQKLVIVKACQSIV